MLAGSQTSSSRISEHAYALNNSPTDKCSCCNKIFSSEEFDTHKCKLVLKDVKRAPVVHFRDDSHNEGQRMTGYDADGILYIFVVTLRKTMAYVLGSSYDGYHNPQTDES